MWAVEPVGPRPSPKSSPRPLAPKEIRAAPALFCTLLLKTISLKTDTATAHHGSQRGACAFGQRVVTPGLGPRVGCTQCKPLSFTVPGVPVVLAAEQEEGPPSTLFPCLVLVGTNPSFQNCGNSSVSLDYQDLIWAWHHAQACPTLPWEPCVRSPALHLPVVSQHPASQACHWNSDEMNTVG